MITELDNRETLAILMEQMNDQETLLMFVYSEAYEAGYEAGKKAKTDQQVSSTSNMIAKDGLV